MDEREKMRPDNFFCIFMILFFPEGGDEEH